MGIILEDNQKFICPRCGSSFFGSTVLDDGSLMRDCHGSGCSYTWHESRDEEHIYVKLATSNHHFLQWFWNRINKTKN